jgi:hypothetical protein
MHSSNLQNKKEEAMGDDPNVVSYLLYSLSAICGTWYMYDRKKQGQSHEDLEVRVRAVENNAVGESRVRQMIEDVVRPVKDNQLEMRGDIKELLRIALEDRRKR